MKRQPGYYWVSASYRGDLRWCVAQWTERAVWYLPGERNEIQVNDNRYEISIEEINETRMPAPDECDPCIIRFDLISARKIGLSVHPKKLMEDIGYKVIKYASGEIGDCVFMQLDRKLNPMPTMCSLSNYKFD